MTYETLFNVIMTQKVVESEVFVKIYVIGQIKNVFVTFYCPFYNTMGI